MKKSILALVALSVVTLGGCANYQEKLATITNNIIATNQAIAKVSSSLAKNCNELEATAKSIAALTSVVSTNKKANGAVSAANAALSTWCQDPPNDIASAIKVTAAQIVAAKTAYEAVKNGG